MTFVQEGRRLGPEVHRLSKGSRKIQSQDSWYGTQGGTWSLFWLQGVKSPWEDESRLTLASDIAKEETHTSCKNF